MTASQLKRVNIFIFTDIGLVHKANLCIIRSRTQMVLRHFLFSRLTLGNMYVAIAASSYILSSMFSTFVVC